MGTNRSSRLLGYEKVGESLDGKVSIMAPTSGSQDRWALLQAHINEHGSGLAALRDLFDRNIELEQEVRDLKSRLEDLQISHDELERYIQDPETS